MFYFMLVVLQLGLKKKRTKDPSYNKKMIGIELKHINKLIKLRKILKPFWVFHEKY